MRRLLATAVLAAACAPAAAQAQAWRIDPDLTRVHWEVVHFGTSTSRGRFDRLEGNLAFDRAARTGEVSVVVDTASVSTGFAPFDNVLRSGSMLASAEHPRAYFVASGFDFEGDRPARVRGELTLRGISQPLVLTALHFACRSADPGAGEICGGDFEAELRRSDFGITFALPFAADRVRLFVSVQARRP